MSDEMDEIWALYADDGAQALDAMEATLMAIEDAPEAAPTSQVAALFRAVHTFKGNSRVLGLSVVESRAHLAEDLIGLVRDAGVTFDAEIHDILMEVTDTLRVMLEATAASHADVSPEPSAALMERLSDKIARCSGAPMDQAQADQAPAVTVVEPKADEQDAHAPAMADPAPVADLSEAFAGLQDLDDAPTQQDDLYDEEPVAEAPVAAVTVAAAPEVAAPEAPAAVTQEPAKAAAPAAAAKPAMRRLFDDPTYRDIFAGMVKDATAKLHAIVQDPAADPQTTRRIVDDLAHAAKQMGLDDWHAAMSAFLSEGAAGAESLAVLLLTLEDLSHRDLAQPAAAPAATGAEGGFFDQLAAPLASLPARHWTMRPAKCRIRTRCGPTSIC